MSQDSLLLLLFHQRHQPILLMSLVEEFLTEKGREFINDKFMTLCETLNINIHTTGAETS